MKANELGFQNEIQERDRGGISAARASAEEAESHHPVRRDAGYAAQTAIDGIPGGKRLLGLLSAIRGSWESGGKFLQKSPERDILDVIDELPKGVRELAFGKRFALKPDEIFVIGGSFGGAAAILASLDDRVKRVIANCPVVDWANSCEGRTAGDFKPQLCGIYSRRVWEWLSPFRQQLAQAAWRQILQPCTPCKGNRSGKDHDVPRQRRSVCSL